MDMHNMLLYLYNDNVYICIMIKLFIKLLCLYKPLFPLHIHKKEVYKPFYFKTFSVSLSVISTKKIIATIRKNKAKNKKMTIRSL